MYNPSPAERLADRIADAHPDRREQALFEGVQDWIAISLDITLARAERAAWTEGKIPSPKARPIILAGMRAALTDLCEREGVK